MQEENKLLLSESLMSSLNSSLAASGSGRNGERGAALRAYARLG